MKNISMYLTLQNFQKQVFPWILFFWWSVIAISAIADQKSTLRLEANRISEQFEKGEITEEKAISLLDAIEKKAQELKKVPPAVVQEVPKEVPKAKETKEEMAGSMLMRRAVAPRLSLWELTGTMLRIFIFGVAICIVIGILYLVIFGIEFINFCSRKVYQQLRENYYPSTPPAMQPVPLPTPQRRNSSPRTPVLNRQIHPEIRHSGEVPDYLT